MVPDCGTHHRRLWRAGQSGRALSPAPAAAEKISCAARARHLAQRARSTGAAIGMTRWTRLRLIGSEDPQGLARELDVVLALGNRGCRERAYGEVVTGQHHLPALAEIHLRLEHHRDAICAGCIGDAHLLESDDSGRTVAGLGRRARGAFDLMAGNAQLGAALGLPRERSLEDVVTA